MIRSSVISWATPRPAVINTRVATIGWIPTTVTRKPFQTPPRAASNSPIPTPTSTVTTAFGWAAESMNVAAAAPAIAATAPTDKSMPRVEMTRVIPMATRRVGATRRRIVINGP